MGIKALIIEGLPKEDKFYSLNVTVDGVTRVPGVKNQGIPAYDPPMRITKYSLQTKQRAR